MRLITFKSSLIAGLTLMLVACGADVSNPQSDVAKVYKSDNSKQCEGDGIALADMRKELSSAGIDVICAQKANTGMAYPAVCGGGTGKINVYLIRTSNIPDAEKLGFKSVKELPDYTDSQCTN